MTVKEVIEELKKFPEDAKLTTWDEWEWIRIYGNCPDGIVQGMEFKEEEHEGNKYIVLW